jgi:hypothetical protein
MEACSTAIINRAGVQRSGVLEILVSLNCSQGIGTFLSQKESDSIVWLAGAQSV